MSNTNPLWQQLLSQAQKKEENVQPNPTPAPVPNTLPPVQSETIPISPPIQQQPTFQLPSLNLNQPVVQNPQPTFQLPNLNPVQQPQQNIRLSGNQFLNVPNPQQELTQLNNDTPPWDDEEEDEDDEELTEYDTGVNNNFSLSIPGLSMPVAQNQQQITQPVKRGRGRPKKIETAAQVMQLLPTEINTQQDQHKSSGNIPTTFAQTEQTTASLTVTIAKTEIRRIAEALQIISQTFFRLSE